jgi:filamentous hemagglutinin family protein
MNRFALNAIARGLALFAAGNALLAAAPAAAFQPGNLLPRNTLPAVNLNTPPSGATVGNPLLNPSGRWSLTVSQSQQQAIINWLSFNVGAGSDVIFKQPNSTAEALNLIGGTDPSIIQGGLYANGRIYLVNQNGILFDRGSQINVRGLIASSLSISSDTFLKGIFSASSITPVAQGGLKVVSLDQNGNPVYNAVENYGTIQSVDPDGSSPGGFIMLFAPRAGNYGTITANNGQVVLAAGEKVYLSPQLGSDGNIDPKMRGMVVEVRANDQPLNLSALIASNFGTLQADRGNVTLVGLAVNQAGNITASTAVNQNGSIYLKARENPNITSGPQRAGTLTLAPGSITQTPVLSDGSTLPDADLSSVSSSNPTGDNFQNYRPQILMEGGNVLIQGRVVSPYGVVTIQNSQPNSLAQRVLLDTTGSIDVSGSVADLPLAKNLLTFKITTDDLKDSPLQKGGFLLGQTVTVDMRNGAPNLFSIAAAEANVARTAQEKTAPGGDITITANQVITMPGSVIDISGGAWQYAGGRVSTTQLVSNGQIFDISSAPAARPYQAMYTGTIDVQHAKWNVTEHFANPLAALAPYEASYVDGKPAGSFTVANATALVLEGTLRSNVSIGPRQLTSGSLPAGARLILGQSLTPVPPLPGITFGTPPALPANFSIDTALPGPALAQVTLSPNLFGSVVAGPMGEYVRTGPSTVQLFSSGNFVVPAGVSLIGPAGSSLSVSAQQFQVAGDIRLPSGSITLAAGSASGADATVSVAPGVTLSTAGRWINDMTAGSLREPSLYMKGGSITLSGSGVSLGDGSLLDVSGGAHLTQNAKLSAGDAGAITITTKGTPDFLENFGTLALGGELRGYSAGGKGGSVKLAAATVLIGDGAPRNPHELVLDPSFFQSGGFVSYDVTGHFDVSVAEGAQLRLLALSRVIDTRAAVRPPSGSDLAGFSTPTLLPVASRQAVNLSLTSDFQTPDANFAPGLPAGVQVGKGAWIGTDPGGSIKLASRSQLDIDGGVSAPAGSITLQLHTDATGLYGGTALTVSSTAQLLAQGAFVDRSKPGGLLQGDLLPGGQIHFDLEKNDLVVAPGAMLDVSGVTAQVDLVQPALGSVAFKRATLGSDAGLIWIHATENVLFDGTVRAQGGLGAAGGTFALELLNHLDVPSSGQQVIDPRLQVLPHIVAISQDAPTQLAPQQGVLVAALGANTLMAGGVERLRVSAQDAVEFQGDVTLRLARSIALDTPQIAVDDGKTASLSAPQVMLANNPGAQNRPAFVPTRDNATGTLNVNADLLELAGNVTLNGAAQARLTSTGDLRADGFPNAFSQPNDSPITDTQKALTGSLTTSGDLTLSAQQIYPSTLVDYTFALSSVASDGTTALASGRTLRIQSAGGAAEPVLSAGGSLTFQADHIVQNGVVKAPLGKLAFDAGSDLVVTDTSLTSVSAAGLVIPFGGTINGQSLFYGSLDETLTPPGKNISFSAPQVTIGSKAVFDLSGGGDVQAVEFIPGIGGSKDTLLQADTYAIVPGLRFAPSDAYLIGLSVGNSTSGANLFRLGANFSLGLNADHKSVSTASGVTSTTYDAIQIGPGGPLPPGVYPLLPGYYALLPGAYVVTRQSGYQDLTPGTVATLANGNVVAGRMASAATGVSEARWSGFMVRPGDAVLSQTEYLVSRSDFFATAAQNVGSPVPSLPADAGRFSINASAGLSFGGVLLANPAAGGRSAEVDLVAPNLAVVSTLDQTDVPSGYVAIQAGQLSGWNASIMLGGVRSDAADGTLLQVQSANVRVMNDGAHILSAPEIILAARDAVSVDAGAVIQAKGSAGSDTRDLLIKDPTDSGGALLRLSTSPLVNVRRDANRGANVGALTVAAGSELSTSGSLLLDATGTTSVRGKLSLPDGGAVSLAANRISLGPDPATSGLVIDASQLDQLGRLGSLTLHSYSSIDLYGSTSFGGSDFKSLTLDAATIVGHNVPDAATSATCANSSCLQASTLTLQNTTLQADGSSAQIAATPGATGNLIFSADTLQIGAGNKSIGGFKAVTLSASGEIRARDAGTLTVAGDLTLQAARIGAEGKSSQTIQARNDFNAGDWHDVLITRPASPVALPTPAAAGGSLSILGASIEHLGNIDMPSGVLELGARGPGGNVLIADGSEIHAQGFVQHFGSDAVAASAGTVTLSSDQGAITVQAAALVDLSGAAEGGNAGQLNLLAPQGTLQLDGGLRASAATGYQSGSVTVDVGSLSNFGQLNAALNLGNFTETRDIRVRGGDVDIPGASPFLPPPPPVVAHHFKLVADNGNIEVGNAPQFGIARGAVIDVSSDQGGGSVELIAGGDLIIDRGSRIDARGTSAASAAADPYSPGGSVSLTSVNGQLTFAQGATIDVSANAAGKSDGGQVLFAAQRGSDDASVKMSLLGQINVGAGTKPTGTGAAPAAGGVVIEGSRTYNAVGNIDTSADEVALSTNNVWNEFATFANSAATIRSSFTGLGLSGMTQNQIQVRAGIELTSTGNMTLSQAWDLTQSSWEVGGVVGRLTLRAAGNLDIQNAIGIPFTTVGSATVLGTINAGTFTPSESTLPSGPTWSLRLVGGADLGSADSTATVRGGAGDVTLSRPVSRVRSGTGSIEVAAAHDFKISDASAAIYTTGQPKAGDSRFAVGGGDISIEAGHDIIGTDSATITIVKFVGGAPTITTKTTSTWINDWLRRNTATSIANATGPGSWWSYQPAFDHNVGALGGGNVSVRAGNDIENFSAVIPTSGQAINTSNLNVFGGGDLTVVAGGSITGGSYLVGRGQGSIRAGGDVGAGPATTLYLMGESSVVSGTADLATRHASISVEARGDIDLQAASNPTILPLSTSQAAPTGTPGFQTNGTTFFTYAPDSAASLVSVAGDITLNDVVRQAGTQTTPGAENWSRVVPSILSVAALQGSIEGPSTTLDWLLPFPSNSTSVKLLAAENVSDLWIRAGDAVPSTLFNWSNPISKTSVSAPQSLTTSNLAALLLGPNRARNVTPAQDPGYRYEVIANNGDISESSFEFPQKASIDAGQDIVNLTLNLQNLGVQDQSQVVAGRDLLYTQFNAAKLAVAPTNYYILIGGPGRLLVQAGRNIDFGNAAGIESVGGLLNKSLPSTFGNDPTVFATADVAVIAGVRGDIAPAAIDTLFAVLTQAGNANDAARGDAAIAALLNGTASGPGNIKMVHSTIKTAGALANGNKCSSCGNIDMLAPNGSIEVGLSTQQQNVNEPALIGGTLQPGIITGSGGAIRVLVGDNIDVNLSKLVTLFGGDILIYTQNGNIDAGRGSRDSISSLALAVDKVLSTDNDGTLSDSGFRAFHPPLNASGSGIRTISYDPDGPGGPIKQPEPGNVSLFASRGFINAGEAGISSAGGFFFAGQLVNAQNITAGGTNVVPAAAAGVSSALVSAASTSAAATRAADDVAKNVGAANTAAFRPSFISVEVMGYGEGGN